MSTVDQLQFLSASLYVVIFVLVLARAIRRPTPAHIDMAVLFGAAAMIIIVSSVPLVLGTAAPSWANHLAAALLLSVGYLLMRLVADFSDVPIPIRRVIETGLIVSVLALVLLPSPLQDWQALLLVAYFVAVIGYDTWAFARQAHRAQGVTRRRMQAVAAGSLCIAVVLMLDGFAIAFKDLTTALAEVNSIIGLASGVFYFVGFAPPTWLRRAWQEPELRRFLSRAASLPRLPDTAAILYELEGNAAATLGAPVANVGLWDPDTQRLRFLFHPPDGEAHASVEDFQPAADRGRIRDGFWETDPATHPISGPAFLRQRASLITDVLARDPEYARMYERYQARSALVAPITAGEKRLGVLIVFAPRAPVFANSDLELVQLLADQAAVILESRALIDEAARVRAREEATRLKDDFLSSAAHDLKTPLTGIVTQAQLLQRRTERDPNAPADRIGMKRLLEQSLRLRDLVLELLDVSRLEHGSLVGQRLPVDLGQLVRDLATQHRPRWQRVKVYVDADPLVCIDMVRIEQVVTNLIENALKYSPHDQYVEVRVWKDADTAEARLSVEDRGIGIPLEDQPLIFERFHRARNVDDRSFVGMGLGLYIARGIVEQHGGRIWVDSRPGVGSTFHVVLPLVEEGVPLSVSDARQPTTTG